MTFIPPFWSPFFGRAEFRRNPLQERAVDVDFEDISESSTQQPKIDKSTRAKQIADAAEERIRELIKKSPMSGLLMASMFVVGATWADEHPLSNYGSRVAWHEAQHEECRRLLTESGASTPNNKDIPLSPSSLLCSLMVLFGPMKIPLRLYDALGTRPDYQ